MVLLHGIARTSASLTKLERTLHRLFRRTRRTVARFIDPVAGLFVLPKPNDGRVSVQSAMLAGMAEHVVVKASHTGLPRHAIAIAQTITFLRDGRFRPSETQEPASLRRSCA
ncbi:hypothetical protein [Bradyrhizobium sp. 199]|uniref:hypothetical protein n=1 Tax=Bradyrhizobium sp. 199 TaxID=2782664 RepID=UPI001FF72F18